MNNFLNDISVKGKNTVVYGNKIEGYDFPVYQNEEKQGAFAEWASERDISAVILTKQMIAEQLRFKKLADYCEAHHITLFDRYGNDIGAICRRAREKAGADYTVLKQQISSHQNISFDLFDTLLMRKTLEPQDVFDLVERRLKKKDIELEDFKHKRINAQDELGLTNPDIYEIYNEMKKIYCLPQEITDICLQEELRIESEILIVRKDMLNLYQQCIAEGKDVYIVTDMYLPYDYLTEILEERGIKGYKKMYLSCREKKLKLQGLFECCRKETDGKPFLHIGDHKIHDGICAELAGIDYCLVDSGYNIALRSGFEDMICKADTLEERVMLGLVIARLFNSPFTQSARKKIEIYSDYDYGYGFCAAIVCQFALWIYEMVKKGEYEDILFASRDGYLIKELYHMVLNKLKQKELPEGIYFYTSRKAAVMTCINNEAYINMVIDISAGMAPEEMLKKRFGLSDGNVMAYDVKKYGDRIHAYIWDHADTIFLHAEKMRLNYFKYMGNIQLKIGKCYAFIDFVSSGTCQKSLNRIVPFELVGLYTGWNGVENKNQIKVHALFEDKCSFFLKNYKVMETFLTSFEPSLSHFDDEGKPVFVSEHYTESEKKYIESMHCACRDFMRDFLEIVEPSVSNIHNIFTDSLFSISRNVIIMNEKSELNHLQLLDDWSGKRDEVDQIIQ